MRVCVCEDGRMCNHNNNNNNNNNTNNNNNNKIIITKQAIIIINNTNNNTLKLCVNAHTHTHTCRTNCVGRNVRLNKLNRGTKSCVCACVRVCV